MAANLQMAFSMAFSSLKMSVYKFKLNYLPDIAGRQFHSNYIPLCILIGVIDSSFRQGPVLQIPEELR